MDSEKKSGNAGGSDETKKARENNDKRLYSEFREAKEQRNGADPKPSIRITKYK